MLFSTTSLTDTKSSQLKLKFEIFHSLFLSRLLGIKTCKNIVSVTIELRSSWETMETWRFRDKSNGAVWEAESKWTLDKWWLRGKFNHGNYISSQPYFSSQVLTMWRGFTFYFSWMRINLWPLMNTMTLGMTGRCLASLKHATDNSKFQISF